MLSIAGRGGGSRERVEAGKTWERYGRERLGRRYVREISGEAMDSVANRSSFGSQEALDFASCGRHRPALN